MKTLVKLLMDQIIRFDRHMTMRKHTKAAALIVTMLFVLVAAYIIYCGFSEDYFIFYPTIDTVFSDNYSEESFSTISVGMSSNDVIKRTGNPLWVQELSCGVSRWWYSADGKAWIGDFAWIGRTVTIKDGKVISTEKRVYYD